MDYDYQVTEQQYRFKHGIAEYIKLKKKTAAGFPLEKSRLRNIWWIALLSVITTALYGFSLGLNIIAFPLILQFFIAYTATAGFSLNSTLVIDLFLGASASAAAGNNLIRCSIGAIRVAVIQRIINAIGVGVTFLMLEGITTFCAPLLVVEWFYGEIEIRERREAEA